VQHRHLLVPEHPHQEPEPGGHRAVAIVVGDDLMAGRDSPTGELLREDLRLRPWMAPLAVLVVVGQIAVEMREDSARNMGFAVGRLTGQRVGKRKPAIDDRKIATPQRDRKRFRLYQRGPSAHRTVSSRSRRLNRIDAVTPQIRCPGTPRSTNSKTERARPPNSMQMFRRFAGSIR